VERCIHCSDKRVVSVLEAEGGRNEEPKVLILFNPVDGYVTRAKREEGRRGRGDYTW
jgi:hypothetical protein